MLLSDVILQTQATFAILWSQRAHWEKAIGFYNTNRQGKKEMKLGESAQKSKKTLFFFGIISNDVLEHIRKDFELHSDIKS